MEEQVLIFDVMDISAETKKILESIQNPTSNMQPNEREAYEMGVCNALAALKVILNCSANHPLHYSGAGNITEMDSDDFMKMVDDDLFEYLSSED